MLDSDYQDFGLVIAHEDGRPYEERQIAFLLRKLTDATGLPPVVFHSLRHCSASLKLQIGGGNIKAVQGDTGHAQSRMVTDLYAHTNNEERRRLAEKPEPRPTSSWDDFGDGPAYAPQREAQPGTERPAHPERPVRPAAVSAPLLQLQPGDGVRHSAFGQGMVLSVRPMGGDALVEVAFDRVGTKRLMLKAAGAHLTKL